MNKEEIIQIGKKLGFELIKVSSAEPFKDYEKIIKERFERNLYPKDLISQEEVLGKIESYVNPSFSLSDAQSIITMAYCYNDGIPSQPIKFGEPRGEIARAYQKNTYGEIKNKTEKMAKILKAKGIKVAEKSRLPLKRAAVRAGIGWQGKNSLIQTEEYGSWILLSSLIIDKEIEQDEPLQRDCGACQMCIKSCPTGAIIAPGIIEVKKCIDYLNETINIIPIELRDKMGRRIISCDRCQEVCPNNRKAKIVTKNIPTLKKKYRQNPLLLPLLTISKKEFEKHFSDADFIELNRDYLLRNVIIALGNAKDPVAIPALITQLQNGSELVQIYAAWALGKFDDEKAIHTLKESLEFENLGARIREEIIITLRDL